MDADSFAMLRDRVRRYIDERRIKEEYAAPPGTIDEMREPGLFGLTVPEEQGGLGHMGECNIERFCRDARLMRIYEGTSQIHQTIIARALLREAGLKV